MSVTEIRALEKARREAMVAGDVQTLTGIMDEEGWYCHGTGDRQTAKKWLQDMKEKVFDFQEVEIADEDIVVFPDTAIVTGVMSVRVRVVGGEELTTKRRLVDVWIRRPGGWKLGMYIGTMMAHGSPAELDAEIQAEVQRKAREAK